MYIEGDDYIQSGLQVVKFVTFFSYNPRKTLSQEKKNRYEALEFLKPNKPFTKCKPFQKKKLKTMTLKKNFFNGEKSNPNLFSVYP